MAKKRGRLQIIHDILEAIKLKGGSIKPTHLLYKSNLSHQMMNDYLQDLIGKGFVEISETGKKRKSKQYVLSQKGYEYLKEYQTVINFIESFGLEED